MPQCPHCQVPFEAGQRYCSTCGSFLLHPEQGNTFCPQCDVRVSPLQEFCHECDAPLKEAPAAPEALGTAPEALPAKIPPSGMPSWLLGVLVGAGILVIILLVLLFTRGTTKPPPPPPAPKVEAPAPAPPAVTATPTAPATQPAPPAEANLKEQLQKELSILREAQLRKDIILFMSVYSLTYPELDDKRASTLKAWEGYDFTNLVFTVDKIQSIDPDNSIAWVTWYMDTKNRQTQELSSSSQSFQVRFAKELGKWRIRSLEEVES
ncbi:MAG: zinc ribbon domain-containing protein [Proteobacteria bacterium]|nr:zinc ribbon domain-containing protein [Pseudomonadota bacterium]MBU4357410.1 zinc ribbon domain-containing protein [Pseudomonadota bacterium]MBU4447764.1 zinc ribbon domain-containing protein [Pseudomonadota bacterium]MCG2772145.1 zinc ribbon domain-containing protein [Desulfobacterales bacterium]